MQIERTVNGQVMSFELTSEELYSAFLEKQHEFDVQDIKDGLRNQDPDEFAAKYGCPVEKILNNDDLIDEIAYEYRNNQDKYNMDWEYARDDAISEILSASEGILETLPDPATQAEPFPGLPELCFSTLPGTGDLIIIKRGEPGYYRTDWSVDDPAKNQEMADGHNAEMGISKAQVAAMAAGSMFGWGCPAANPEAYDENGALKPVDKEVPLEDKIAAAEKEKNSTSGEQPEQRDVDTPKRDEDR